MAVRRPSSVFLSVDKYFHFRIINADNATLHKYMAGVCLGSFLKLLEILSNSQDRIHLVDFFLKVKLKSAPKLQSVKSNILT